MGDLKSHQSDRTAAKKAMAEATALREKEKAAYDKALAENKANLAATLKATAAISAGMEGSFLQTGTADVLRNLVSSRQSMASSDRQELLAFLSGEQGNDYAPASGEIVGILKTMADEMAADQKEMISTEQGAVSDYEALIAAKKKEVSALTKSIETKMGRVGELGVEIATLKNDAEDTAESLEEDQKFAGDMKKNCAEKIGIHEEEKKVRSQEVVALADIPEEAPGGIANTGIAAFVQVSMRKDAPPLPPATAAAYSKKSGESNSVIAMMDLLVKDLDEEMTVSETEETNSQAEYEKTIAEAADKRRQDSKSITDKEAAKADLESVMEKSVGDKKSATKDLMGTDKYIASLHSECDWLLKYFEVRKEARADEIDALGKAKAVLNGAD